MKYRVGLDVGTNSLGLAVLELEDTNGRLVPIRVEHLGSRIFSDARNPKDGSSNAAARRGPRGMRRNRDRRLNRKRRLMDELIDFSLMPEDNDARKALEAHDPWILRAKALDPEQYGPMPLHHIGRALFHLNQRRGFKSNRKTDKAEDSGPVKDAIAKTKAELSREDARTLGELFGKRRNKVMEDNANKPAGQRAPLPLARVRSGSEGSKTVYDYYPTRSLIMDEFDLIWRTQSPHHPEMTDQARKVLAHRIEYQRPLKAQPVGKCTLIETESRAPKALPSAQLSRVLQEINNLSVGKTGQQLRLLTPQERTVLSEYLLKPSNKTARREFKSIRKELGLLPSDRFNLESEKRSYLVGDETAAALKDSWGPSWHNLPLAEQDEIILKLLNTEKPEEMLAFLMGDHGFDQEAAQIISDTKFKDAHGQLSQAALTRLMPHLEAGMTYDKAVIAAGFTSHSQLGDGVIHDEKLPYYGEVLSRHVAFAKPAPEQGKDTRNAEEKAGKIANPTVHVALNQVGKVLNDIMEIYGGPPEQVVLELARDLPLSAKGKSELEREQKKGQDQNEKNRLVLAEYGASDSYVSRLKLRLYNQLLPTAKLCIYSGETISLERLFSADIEIDHILPYSRTLDDGFNNKVLCTRQANQNKGNRAPFEAFGHDHRIWEDISTRAQDLPSSKNWRFAPDAMERFENEGRDFLARQLNDTKYIARLAKRYVEAIYGGQGVAGQENRVWVVSGQLTADLRHYAGLNSILSDHNRKDRTDHRHHAIDAAVIAFTDRSMVKRASYQAKRDYIHGQKELLNLMAEPLRAHREAIKAKIENLVVSHKPDHGYQGAMHNDTAYGLTGETDEKGQAVLVTRKPLSSFERPAELEKIRDHDLKLRFLEATQGLTGKAFKEAVMLEAKAQHPHVNKVRIITPMKPSSFVTIGHDGNPSAKAYKGDGNYCYDIWGDSDKKGNWVGEVITTYQAYQLGKQEKEWWRKPFGRYGQKLALRLRKGDMLEIEYQSKSTFVKIYKFSKGQIYMAEHFEANASARVRSKDLPAIQMSPSSLQKAKAVRITVSPAGTLRRHKTI